MEILNDFKVNISAINVKDFGDFRRKSNSYLNRLKDQLPPEKIGPVYEELKNLINFKPSWQIEPTRRAILEKVDELQAKLGSSAGRH